MVIGYTIPHRSTNELLERCAGCPADMNLPIKHGDNNEGLGKFIREWCQCGDALSAGQRPEDV